MFMSQENSKNFKDLYKISKFVYNESFLEGYLDSSGPQKDSFLKKVEKNSKTVRRNAVGMKFLSGIYMLILNMTPINVTVMSLTNGQTATRTSFRYVTVFSESGSSWLFALTISP